MKKDGWFIFQLKLPSDGIVSIAFKDGTIRIRQAYNGTYWIPLEISPENLEEGRITQVKYDDFINIVNETDNLSQLNPFLPGFIQLSWWKKVLNRKI